MKHLILFEAYGIDSNIENQVDEYFQKVKSNPDESVFNLLFRNDIENVFFKLIINPDIDVEGRFVETNTGRFEITIKNRDDVSTILHEVKHLDFRIRNKKLEQTVHYKAERILNNYADTPKALIEVFYLYDENEFQSKYHGYYKDFKIYCQDKITSKSTLQQIKYHWMKYLLSCNDSSWAYYLCDTEFKFENFISDKKLDLCLFRMIESGVNNSHDKLTWGKNWLVNNLKLIWSEIRKKLGFYSKEERREIDKLKRYFENQLQLKHKKFRRKFTRMITAIADQYGINY